MRTALFVCLVSSGVLAQPVVGPIQTRRVRPQPGQVAIDFHADLQNVIVYRNDSDFDRSPPAYNANGQTVGLVGTLFRPTLIAHANEHLRMVYQAELGMNAWSRHNPDQALPQSPDWFFLLHRQLFAEGELADDKVGFRVGFSHFQDPTGLFFNHWLGVGQVAYLPGGESRYTLFGGQLADPTFEGNTAGPNNLRSDIYPFARAGLNNFRRDISFFGVAAELPPGDTLRVLPAVHVLYDTHLVGKTRWVASPSARLEGRFGAVRAWLDASLQVGRAAGMTFDGSPETTVAWAAQQHGEWSSERFSFAWNLLVMSADDGVEGNGFNGGYLTSGRNASATVLLTEDEVRDWADNLDERMAANRTGFFLHRAGLAVADVKGSWRMSERVRPALIVGTATVLNPDNALGSALVGLETDLLVELHFSDNLALHLLAGGLLPGGAGAVLINRIDLGRRNPVAYAEASLFARF